MLDHLQPIMMVAGLSILCWLMVRSRFLAKQKSRNEFRIGKLRQQGPTSSPNRPFQGTESLGAPPEVLRWQVELHDLGRDLKGELDSKMLAVRSLTRSYDRASKQLGRMIELAQQATVDPETPWGKAKQLQRQGWSQERIAQALGFEASEIAELLTPAEATDNASPHQSGLHA